MALQDKKSRDLIAVAKTLLNANPKRPKIEHLNRAVSSAYYALFHRLCRLAADELIGGSRSGQPDWLRVYRCIDHGQARIRLQALGQSHARNIRPRFSQHQTVPPVAPPSLALLRIATDFPTLQAARHDADYDPSYRPTKADVGALISMASARLDDVDGLAPDERRLLALDLVLPKSR